MTLALERRSSMDRMQRDMGRRVRVRPGVLALLCCWGAVVGIHGRILQGQTGGSDVNRGALALMRGDCAAAEKDFRAVLAAAPADASALGLLGVCEKRLGQADAEKHLVAGFAKVTDRRLRTEIGVELADDYYQRGDLDHVLPVVRTLVSLNPENTDILFFAQNVYQEMADDTLNKLALLAPESPRMQQAIAERLVNAGDLKGAEEHYRQALKVDPYLPGAHFELAEVILEGNPNSSAAQQEAQEELKMALRVDGESARIECEFARDAYLQSRLDEALEHYRRAHELVPGDVKAQMGMARILMRQGKPEEALPLVEQAVGEDPLNGEAHYRYAMALKATGHAEEAQEQMRSFQTIHAAQEKTADLYRQMNRRAKPEAGQMAQGDANNP